MEVSLAGRVTPSRWVCRVGYAPLFGDPCPLREHVPVVHGMHYAGIVVVIIVFVFVGGVIIKNQAEIGERNIPLLLFSFLLALFPPFASIYLGKRRDAGL